MDMSHREGTCLGGASVVQVVEAQEWGMGRHAEMGKARMVFLDATNPVVMGTYHIAGVPGRDEEPL